MSLDRLIQGIIRTNNPTVVGLDPKFEYLPDYLKEEAAKTAENPLEAAANAVLSFNRALIDSLCDIVPAVKPQCAYYECYGWYGMRTLAETINYAKEKGMFVITDGKRNDIGTTMESYAAAHLGKVNVYGQEFTPFAGDALTVNGYLGSDGIRPLLPICKDDDRGIFVLVKTSNPSSGELQDKLIDGLPVYEVMGKMCESWGSEQIGEYGYSAVGAVVGATYPEQLTELRKKLPHTFFLVPGYGAQGGGAKDVAGAFDERGLGAVVNSSRGILCAYKKEENCDPHDFAGAARREAIRMQKDITSCLTTR